MNYIGSKLSLLGFLEESIDKVVDKDCQKFCDLFAGTGVVGSLFRSKGYSIIANDIQYYSFVLNKHRIGNHRELRFTKLAKVLPQLKSLNSKERRQFLCEYLSELPGKKGFIYRNYCRGGTRNKKTTRQFYSDENGMLCDAIREQIEDWKASKLISKNEYYFLVASLIKSIDRRANTASVYGAFLKKLKRSAQSRLVMRPLELIINVKEHKVFNQDANKLVRKIESDILYLDPPYNHRQYATNYHLLETIASYDNPKIHGVSGLRDYDGQKSLYCQRRHATEAFKDLIMAAKTKYIFLSYNNEGLIPLRDIKRIMSSRGRYGVFKKKHSRFKADRTENRNYKANTTTEYLHYVVCKNSQRRQGSRGPI